MSINLREVLREGYEELLALIPQNIQIKMSEPESYGLQPVDALQICLNSMQALVAVGYQPEQIAALWEKHGDSLFWLSQDEGLYQQLID